MRHPRFVFQYDAWRSEYPAKDVEFIEKFFDEQHYIDHTCDTFRVARVGHHTHEQQYAEVALDGCCGSSDFIITGPSGAQYRVGFNYGH